MVMRGEELGMDKRAALSARGVPANDGCVLCSARAKCYLIAYKFPAACHWLASFAELHVSIYCESQAHNFMHRLCILPPVHQCSCSPPTPMLAGDRF